MWLERRSPIQGHSSDWSQRGGHKSQVNLTTASYRGLSRPQPDTSGLCGNLGGN